MPSEPNLPEADVQPVTSGVRRSLRALLVESDTATLRPIEVVLRKHGFEPVIKPVTTATELGYELANGRWDIVFSNPLVPGFEGIGPLGLLRARNLDIPCVVIIVQLDEQRDAAIIKAGARDVVRLDQLYRLPSVVTRELASSKLRRAHRKALTELAATSNRLRALVDAAPIAVIEIDSKGMVQTWNTAAQRICGWPPRSAIGQPLPMLPDDASTEIFAMCTEAGRGRSFAGIETRWLGSEGDAIELTVSLAPIDDGDGRLLLLATPRGQMTRLKRQLDSAQLNEAFGQLAQGIAAEIRTPMKVIRNELDFITSAVEELTSVVAAQRKEAIAKIITQPCKQCTTLYDHIDVEFLMSEIPRSLEKLRGATNRTEQIARAMGEVSPTPTGERQPCDINRAVESTTTVARSEFRHIADMVFDLQPDLPPVMGVQSELSLVLLNLIVNAAHAVAAAVGTKGRGAITISTCADDEQVQISVSDTGIGIPARDQLHIFEPFFTTKPTGKGSGQGLSLSKTIVERHRGSIVFKSTEGQGSTFTVRLPLHGSSSPSRA